MDNSPLSWFSRFLDKHSQIKRWWKAYTHFEEQCEARAIWIWSGWRGISLFAFLCAVVVSNAAAMLFFGTYTVVLLPILVMSLTLLLHMRTIYRRVHRIKGWRARFRAWCIARIVRTKRYSWQQWLDDIVTTHSALTRWVAGLLLTVAMLTLAWGVYQTIAQYSSLNETLRDALFSLSPINMVFLALYFMFEDALVFSGVIDDVSFDVTLRDGEGEVHLSSPIGKLSGYSNEESSSIQSESSHGLSVDVSISDSTIKIDTERAGS
ncbi:hypothetical protein QTV44_002509 [Vibrio vulnificus]|nr:hypothetical protein [Vibrio vulnificus]